MTDLRKQSDDALIKLGWTCNSRGCWADPNGLEYGAARPHTCANLQDALDLMQWLKGKWRTSHAEETVSGCWWQLLGPARPDGTGPTLAIAAVNAILKAKEMEGD